MIKQCTFCTADIDIAVDQHSTTISSLHNSGILEEWLPPMTEYFCTPECMAAQTAMMGNELIEGHSVMIAKGILRKLANDKSVEGMVNGDGSKDSISESAFRFLREQVKES